MLCSCQKGINRNFLYAVFPLFRYDVGDQKTSHIATPLRVLYYTFCCYLMRPILYIYIGYWWQSDIYRPAYIYVRSTTKGSLRLDQIVFHLRHFLSWRTNVSGKDVYIDRPLVRHRLMDLFTPHSVYISCLYRPIDGHRPPYSDRQRPAAAIYV